MPFTLTGTLPFTVTGTGPEGEYVISSVGYRPELGKVFHYKDERHDFHFYVQLIVELRTLNVCHTSSEHIAGVAIDAADEDYLKQNITHYFENVSFLSFDRIEPPNPVPTVTFDWRVRELR